MPPISEWLVNCGSSYEGCLLLLCGLGAISWQIAGFAAARQWYLLPLMLGLSTLAVFLLNPLADANSQFDLRMRLGVENTLLTLTLLQVLLSGISFVLGLKLSNQESSGRWRVLLGALHCLPALPVLVASVFFQQQWLAEQVGSRPELVGIVSGSVIAAMLLGGTLLGWLLSVSQRAQLHLLGCLCLIAVLCLVPSLSHAVPATRSQATEQAVSMAILPGFALIAGCMGLGWLLQHRQNQRYQSAGVP